MLVVHTQFGLLLSSEAIVDRFDRQIDCCRDKKITGDPKNDVFLGNKG